MDRIPLKTHRLLYNLIYFCLVFSLVYLLGLGFNLKLSIVLQIIIVLIGSLNVKFLLLNPLFLYIILATGFLCALIINRYNSTILFTFFERVYLLFQNIINNLMGKENIADDNMLLFWGLLLILVSIFTAFILFKKKSIYILLPIYIGSFITYWYNYYDISYWLISFFLLVFFILMGVDNFLKEDIIVEKSKKNEFMNVYTPWIKTTTWYSIIIILLALLLPKTYNYIQWPWLQQKVFTTFPFVKDLRSYNIYKREAGEAALFNFSITGFQSQPTRLGGSVELSDKKIMTVRADSTNYLRGNVRQLYNGNAWDTITRPHKSYGLRQDFSGITKEDRRLYYKSVNIIITNHDFASTTLFSPFKPSSINFNNDMRVNVTRDDSLVFTQGVYDGESYYVEALKPLPYGMLLSLGKDEKIEDLDDLDIYLQIPDDKITERTKYLVKQIVVSSDNDYNKAIAIENYLRNNYKYNLKVEDVPENQEFIDYFLFDGKEGYCTYYATSMAIMLRLECIPSRYIEGYLAKDPIETGVYEVRHRNAHAWVEAFIEPVGWMTFEPTPSFPIESRLEGYQMPEPEETRDPRISSRDDTNTREDIDGPEIESDQDFGIDNWRSYNDDTNEETSIDITKNIAIIIVGILLLIIPIRFIIGFVHYKYQERMSQKLPNNKRIIYLYKHIHKLMELLGYPQKYGETHNEYAKRVAYKFFDHKEKGIKEITEIFVKSKYSTSPATDADVLDLIKYRETLEYRLSNQLGIRAYYYRKYIKKEI